MSLWLGTIASSISTSNLGIVLLKPTSINHAGTSASIGTNGQITFTAVTSLSLNGVFSTKYENYMINIRHSLDIDSQGINARLRSSGTDATGADYTWQYLLANGNSLSANRLTSQTFFVVGNSSTTFRSGDTSYIYGPFLAQPTATRHINAWGYNNVALQDDTGTHSLSTSYDGITLYPAASRAMTGAVQVYGMRS